VDWIDYASLAGGCAWVLYVVYEAVRTYKRTPGDDLITAFHGFASVLLSRAIEAAGAVVMIVDSVPALQGMLPDKSVGATMMLVARGISTVRLIP